MKDRKCVTLVKTEGKLRMERDELLHGVDVVERMVMNCS
jgi:hypothetical protein